AVLGAVGQPRDGDPRAAYALFDPSTRMLTIRRVPYDIDSAAAKIRRAGLPLRLADRLYEGR
ncbi:MAG: metallophosphoesterase family protein, partial [Beijerinckiaceae bacterium]